jgi:hypothetical protein
MMEEKAEGILVLLAALKNMAGCKQYERSVTCTQLVPTVFCLVTMM